MKMQMGELQLKQAQIGKKILKLVEDDPAKSLVRF
jgi:hypothetical protein